MPIAPSRPHEEAVIEELRDDPAFAAEYLNAILEDGDQQELMTALRQVAKAFGGVSQLAEKADLNASALYRTLSPQGNPELKSLTAMLNAMGMRLAVQPIARARLTRTPELGTPQTPCGKGVGVAPMETEVTDSGPSTGTPPFGAR
jgi:probable addiction module antidote protein